ncbi:hypothetical protein [Vibrio sp. WXL103]|uniref:hypothetical protein n=1 Tax=Vibrio sp. WXL103 TaxID=3450710 RepID=UPI003EC615B2
MKKSRLKSVLLITGALFSVPTAYACPFHDLVTDGLTDEISITIGYYIKHNRKTAVLEGNLANQRMAMYLFSMRLSQVNEAVPSFHLRQALDGHYSSFEDSSGVKLVEYKFGEVLPILITETDVLLALAQGKLTWQFAKEEGLVSINAGEEERKELDRVFGVAFSEQDRLESRESRVGVARRGSPSTLLVNRN